MNPLSTRVERETTCVPGDSWNHFVLFYFSLPVCKKTCCLTACFENTDEHSSVTGPQGGMRAPLVTHKEDCFPASGFCTHIGCTFPITHLANRKESQTRLDLWPKTATIPLCSDKWPWVFGPQEEEEHILLEMIKVKQFCLRDKISETMETRLNHCRWGGSWG